MHRIVVFVALIVIAGCSKPADFTSPLTQESSRLAPGLPPIEQANPPRLRVWTDDGWRQFQQEGGFSLETIYDLSVPEGQTVMFHWTSHPAGQTVGTRWTLDIEDLFDETPRIDEDTDLDHWSVWSREVTSATVGPFEAGTVHLFYIEARSKVGLFSLFPVRVTVTDSATDLAG